jgi:hypothetical protein
MASRFSGRLPHLRLERGGPEEEPENGAQLTLPELVGLGALGAPDRYLDAQPRGRVQAPSGQTASRRECHWLRPQICQRRPRQPATGRRPGSRGQSGSRSRVRSSSSAGASR